MIFGDSQVMSLEVRSTDLSWPKLNKKKLADDYFHKSKNLMVYMYTCIGKDDVTKQAWIY